MDSKKSLFIRVNGETLKTETTEDEKNFRETHFAEAKSVLKKSLNCTACGKNLREKVIDKDIHVHPVLEVLWCKKCEEFYSDGEFSADEDGSDKYCRWCAQGGELYCCSYCSVAFCKKCVKRNLPKQTLKDIEDDDWKCFVCVTEPLWKLRGVCDAAKRYTNFGFKSRKSTRKTKNHSEEDTVESDVSNTKRTKRNEKSTTDSTEDEKYNADSEDTSSLRPNKNKRKHVSSSEDTSSENKSRRRKINNEETKPKPHPDENSKKKFEAIITNALNDFAVLRKLITKKETVWKKNYLGFNVKKLSDVVSQSKEEFPKLFSDVKTSINLIEKSFTDRFEIFENELNQDKEEAESAPIKENDTTNDVPKVDDADEEMADVSIVKETTEEEPRKSSNVSMNGSNDMSLTVFNDDSMTGISDKPTETDASRKSISDSLAVNVSSIIDSLNSDEENELRNQNNSLKEVDPIEVEPSKPDSEPESDTQIITSDKKNDDDEGNITEPVKEVPFVEEDAKISLLQSSSENNTTDNEVTKKISTDSELSGVDVLHSDQDDVVKTKHKKKKTRKELDSLISKESKLADDDVSDEDKVIERLSDLNNLKKRKAQRSSESDNEVTENVVEKKDRSSTKKKKVERTSLVSYFGEGSGNDTDGSNVSFSKFNSVLKDKNESILNGQEHLSKKILLEFSSEDEKIGEKTSDDDIALMTSDEEHGSSGKKSAKCDEKESSKNGEIDGGSSKKKTYSNSSSDEFVTDSKKKEKSKWRKDGLLKGKLSETDTSDEEKIIKREKRKLKKEAEAAAEKSDHSSDSEDIFRTNKKSASTKKRRKAKVASSGSEFEIDNKEDSDDSVQIVSEGESTPPSKSKKKRKRIKNLDDSDNSNEKDDDEKNPGSASKGRKNIKKILKDEDLAEITKRTAREEEERKRRISERQAIFNESFKVDEDINKAPDRLVLDFDPETKKEVIVVHKDLVKKLKPHQAKGVKFMWDSCFESVKMVETTDGGGCILAHCMGLGKTLQVITLVHTVMRYPQLKINRVLVLCPLSTVLNWVAEFAMWLQDVDYGDDIDVFHLNKVNNCIMRADMLNNWFRQGGVMIMGYEMFRNLVNTNKVRKKIKQHLIESLLDPGPDLVVCDEGHMLKNEQSAISQATMKIRTKRRIVLTGTPLQNNLTEYHCMVQFVKKNLLGDKKEFLNRFANPITNGQYQDSTSHDVRVMKRRAHVLHKMLDGVIQRFDYKVLTPFLPSKHEFVILVGLSDLQAKLYEFYIDHYSKKFNPSSTLFKDYQIMRLIWTHPYAMKLSEDRKRKIMEKKMEQDDDSEGSLRDFVVNTDESEKTSESDSDSSVVSIRSDDSVKSNSKANSRGGRLTRGKKKELDLNDEELVALDNGGPAKDDYEEVWWKSMVSEEELNDYRMGPKLVLLFAIIQQCENIGDKVLVFSQSIPSLDMIEFFLEKWEEIQQNDASERSSDHYGTWEKGIDYFRLDGQTPPEQRTAFCNSFNKTSNTRSRLFLISTKAGGLGINLTAANRVIIFDASWNPSYDVQSIFRVYRFGQSKPCYIYRFLSQGTMEEKIYERQVTKLSISCRVVDEQQIDRHFNNADIVALYEFNRKTPSEDEIPKLPKDRLMAEILKEYKHAIVGYHEHDSLLENQVEEELTEEERKQAWEDYENEKKGMSFQQQQFNQMNMAMGMMQNAPNAEMNFDRGTIMDALRKEHPNVSESQLQVMHSLVVQKLQQHYLSQLRMKQMQHMQKTLQMRAVPQQQQDAQAASMQQSQAGNQFVQKQ